MLLVQSYKKFIVAGFDFKATLAKVLGKKKFLPSETIEALAEAHAEAYGEKFGETIHYQQTSTGTWCFYSDESCKREFRHNTCWKQWQREVEPYQQVTKRKAVGKQVDEVAKLVKQFEALSKTQQAKFLRIVQ